MGDFEETTELHTSAMTRLRKVRLIAILITSIAFLAPAFTNGGYYGYSFTFTIVALFYYIHVSNYGVGLYFPDIYSAMGLIPFLIFRVAFAYQITRYYQGKTTKGRTAAAVIISDTPILVIWFLSVGISGAWGLYFPLPIMMIIGLLLLRKYPAPEATVPWDGEARPITWWEEESEENASPDADIQKG